MLPTLVVLFQPNLDYLFGQYLQPYCSGQKDVTRIGMITKPDACHHNSFKMTKHAIGQEKCPKFLTRCHIKFSLTHKAVITMQARKSRNIFPIEKRIKLIAGAAITIDDNLGGPSFSGSFDLCLYTEHNFFQVVMPCHRSVRYLGNI